MRGLFTTSKLYLSRKQKGAIQAPFFIAKIYEHTLSEPSGSKEQL